jgi:hypothetical protein
LQTPNGLPVAWPRRGFNITAQLNISSRGPRLSTYRYETTTEDVTVYTSCISMGVNHGGTNPSQNLQWGDANTGCPPRFLSFFKISSARHGSVPPDFNLDLRHCVYRQNTPGTYTKLAFAFTQHIDRFRPSIPTDLSHPSHFWTPSSSSAYPLHSQPITERCPLIRDARSCAAHCWATFYPVPNSDSTRVRSTRINSE